MSNNDYKALQKKQQASLTQTDSSYVSPTSFTEAVCRGNPPISVVRKQKPKELTTWVKARLIEVFSYLGAYNNVSKYQVTTLARRICDKFFYFTPAELDYFFVCFSNGEYRKLYNGGSVNPQDIMMSLIDYSEDLLAARGEAEIRRKQMEEEKKREEEKKKPHGYDAWVIYCRKHGLDPKTHTIQPVSLRNVNEELNPPNKEKS